MKLDWKAELFQSHVDKKHTELNFNGSEARVVNIEHGTEPCILHTTSNYVYLNHLSNYVPKAWNYVNGCLSCDEDMVKLQVDPLHAFLVLVLSTKTYKIFYTMSMPICC